MDFTSRQLTAAAKCPIYFLIKVLNMEQSLFQLYLSHLDYVFSANHGDNACSFTWQDAIINNKGTSRLKLDNLSNNKTA
jgi:hypothetical protein